MGISDPDFTFDTQPVWCAGPTCWHAGEAMVVLRRVLSTATMRLRSSELPKSVAELRSAFSFVTTRRTEFADLDAYQHVNNTMYLRYFESARVLHWSSQNAFGAQLAAQGISPVLADTWCHFKRPLGMADTIHVGLRAEKVLAEQASFEHRYVVWSEALGDVAAQGGATIVLCDFDQGGRRATGLTLGSMEQWL